MTPHITAGRSCVDVTVQSASEFLALLDPTRGLFASGRFIFRGVSSEHHNLLPSAHRPGALLFGLETAILSGPLDYVHQQCGAEFYTLHRFFGILSKNGVRVPEDSYLLRAKLDEWRIAFQQRDLHYINDRVWPSAELYSLLALAQHHGIPTRALDWTWSSFVAAYFAARGALQSRADDSIAVWAIDDFHRQLDRILNMGADRPLQVFTVSGADNDNLRAQRGLFMLHPQRLTDEAVTFTPQEYSELLNESLAVLKGATHFIRVLVKHSEAQKVLALLHRAGVTTGTLYPGLWGAAREYEDSQQIRPELTEPFWNIDDIGLWDRINEVAKSVGA